MADHSWPHLHIPAQTRALGPPTLPSLLSSDVTSLATHAIHIVGFFFLFNNLFAKTEKSLIFLFWPLQVFYVVFEEAIFIWCSRLLLIKYSTKPIWYWSQMVYWWTAQSAILLIKISCSTYRVQCQLLSWIYLHRVLQLLQLNSCTGYTGWSAVIDLQSVILLGKILV